MRGHSYFIVLLLILATLAVFWPVCSFDFLIWDDDVNVYENPYLNPPTLEGVLRFWQKPYALLYIPLTYTVWAMEAKLSLFLAPAGFGIKLNPQVFHTANLVFHLFNVLLVFNILKILLNCYSSIQKRNLYDLPAGFGALLFALHPLQVEPVAWVTGTKDVLSGFFLLIAIWQYLVYSTMHEVRILDASQSNIKTCNFKSAICSRHYLLASLAFLLAVLAKPSAVVAPFIILILDCLILSKPVRHSLSKLIVWVVVSAPIIIITKISQPDMYINFITPLWARPFVAGDALAFYLYKLMFPIWLGADYGRSPQYVLGHFWGYLTWIFPCLLLFLMYLHKNRKPYLAAAGIFIVGLLPILGFIPFDFQDNSTVGDRYLYISMLGVAFVAAFFVLNVRKSGVLIICLCVLGIFGVRSANQIWRWENTFTLYEQALKINYESQLAHNNLGVAYGRAKNFDKAAEHYTEAIRIKPNYIEAHINLGVANLHQKKFDDAISQFNWAIKINPNSALAHTHLGNALAEAGRDGEALNHYKRALQIDPDDVGIYNDLGFFYSRQKNLERALSSFEKALKLKPNSSQVYNNIGSALAESGRIDEALEHYRKALQIYPENVEAHNNVGTVLFQRGQVNEAIRHFSEALRLMPDYADGHYSLGSALALQGNLAGAVFHYKKSLLIEPDDPEINNLLGVALGRQNNDKDAIARFNESLRIKPDYADAHNNLGIVLFKQGLHSEAKAHFDKAVRLKAVQADALSEETRKRLRLDEPHQ